MPPPGHSARTPGSTVTIGARPLAYCRKLLCRTFALFGQFLAPLYLRTSRNFVRSELKWINKRTAGATDFYTLMPLYTSLQRVLFIHIPKCGGTSIRKTLVQECRCAPIPPSGAGVVNQSIEYMISAVPPRSPQGQLLQSCATQHTSEPLRQRFLRVFTAYDLATSPERVFLLGHKPARELVSYRRNSKDIMLTTVRSPIGMLKSMAAYRVSHTLKNTQRQDSIELLELLQLDIHAFTELARTQPEQLTGRILENQSPSLAAHLTLDSRTDHISIWEGIQGEGIFIAHMSEQAHMLSELFGQLSHQHRINTSDNRQGLAAEFTAGIQDSWIEPFIDTDSRQLYQRLESNGIIGFWKKGGTASEYRDLLASS